MPHGLPPWPAVYQLTRRWPAAGVVEADVHDLREVWRAAAGRAPEPTAVIPDSRSFRSTPESGARAGYDGAKRGKGAKLQVAVGTLGHMLARHATPANAQDRAPVAAPAGAARAATGRTVKVAFVDRGYTGEQAATDAAAHGIRLEAVKLTGARRGFVLLPRRWVVERGFAWTGRFRRLARDYERLHTTLEGFNDVAFALLALQAARPLLWVL